MLWSQPPLFMSRFCFSFYRTGKESFLFSSDILAFSQAEADLRVSQGEFDRQYEVTKLLLDGISTAHVSEIIACL